MSGGGTRKVLAWGECPPPSSPREWRLSLSSSWNGAWCPDSFFRTQILEGDTVTSTSTQSYRRAFSSVAWRAFPSCPQKQIYAPRDHPLDLSPPACPLSEMGTASLQLRAQIRTNTCNSEFPNDTNTQDVWDVSVGEGFHEHCW